MAPGEPEAELDKEWIERTDEANKNETARLETELRGYKNNLVKESVRVCLPHSPGSSIFNSRLMIWDIR